MKKIALLILALTLATGLTACSNVSETSNSTSNTNSSENISKPVSDESSEKTDNSSNESKPVIDNEITARFELPNSDPVDLANVIVTGFDGEMALSEMTADNWQSLTCDGVYLAEAAGVYYDNINNADLFDEQTYSFTGAPETVFHEYKKYKVGDMFGSLKLIEGRTEFSIYSSDMDPKFFNGGSVRFEGEITLTGKCWLSPETEGYDTKRDIHFVPDAKSAKLLPIMYYFFDENGNEYTVGGEMNGFCFLAEHSDFYLGNADDYSNLDFREFPEDGACLDAQVTVGSIYRLSNKQWGVGFECSLIDLEIIKK